MHTNLLNQTSLQAPFWCINGHVHTIAPSLLHGPQKPSVEWVEIPTPDDDFLELDVIDAANDRPVIVLFHGLEGSTDRYYMVDLMRTFSDLQWSVIALNFRGCGTRMNRRRRFYHAGETGDLATVFNWARKRFPKSNMGAVGFSLGGNALLKSLGEEKKSHPADAAVAVSVPYDLKAGSQAIHRGFNRLYEWLFVQSMRKKINRKRKYFRDLPPFSGSSLYDFDDQVTAPLNGFNNAEDYYARCSSAQFIPKIQTPALLIHSREDPLCSIDTLPLRKIRENADLDFVITEKGGHVGFWSKSQGWLSRIIANYFKQKLI